MREQELRRRGRGHEATTSDVRAALLGEKVWRGGVNCSGSRLTTGLYSTSRLGLGLHSFRFHLAGLGIPSLGFPVVAAQPLAGSPVTTSVTSLSLSLAMAS